MVILQPDSRARSLQASAWCFMCTVVPSPCEKARTVSVALEGLHQQHHRCKVHTRLLGLSKVHLPIGGIFTFELLL